MAKTVELNGRGVVVATIQVAGVDHRDYPDYADAYVESAQYVDGTDLTDDELDQLQDQHPDVVYDVINESAVDLADFHNDMLLNR